MSDELKPCPFCKSALVEAEPSSKYFSHPGGMNCILDGFDMDADGDPDLVVLWNRRAQPAEEVQHDAMEKALRLYIAAGHGKSTHYGDQAAAYSAAYIALNMGAEKK